jgi:hypothetical protein
LDQVGVPSPTQVIASGCEPCPAAIASISDPSPWRFTSSIARPRVASSSSIEVIRP